MRWYDRYHAPHNPSCVDLPRKSLIRTYFWILNPLVQAHIKGTREATRFEDLVTVFLWRGPSSPPTLLIMGQGGQASIPWWGSLGAPLRELWNIFLATRDTEGKFWELKWVGNEPASFLQDHKLSAWKHLGNQERAAALDWLEGCFMSHITVCKEGQNMGEGPSCNSAKRVIWRRLDQEEANVCDRWPGSNPSSQGTRQIRPNSWGA